MTETLAFFDYEALDDQTRRIVQQHTGDIKRLAKRVALTIVEIGKKLIEVKEALGHGRFGEWLLAEFEWTERTAQHFMRVYETFKHENFSDLRIAPSALYLFASPSTPESAREEGIARARAGETMTHAKALEIKAVQTQHEREDFSEVLLTGRGRSGTETDIQSDDEAEWAFLADPFIDNWVETIYHQTMEMRESHAARAVAGALNPEQLRKIRAIIAFLQRVVRTDNNLSRSW